MVCVAVIALLLVYTLGDNEISGPGGNAGSALLASGGNAFAAAGEEAAQMAVPVPSEDATAGQGKNGNDEMPDDVEEITRSSPV